MGNNEGMRKFSHKDIDKMSKHLIWDLLQMDDTKFESCPKSVRNKVGVIAHMFNTNDKESSDDYWTKDFDTNVEQLSFFEEEVINQNDEIRNLDDWLDISPLKTCADNSRNSV